MYGSGDGLVANSFLCPAPNCVVRGPADSDFGVCLKNQEDTGRKRPRRYFWAFEPLAAAASAFSLRKFSYFFWNRSTLPALSTSFCLPVKKGWQFEQISTCS